MLKFHCSFSLSPFRSHPVQSQILQLNIWCLPRELALLLALSKGILRSFPQCFITMTLILSYSPSLQSVLGLEFHTSPSLPQFKAGENIAFGILVLVSLQSNLWHLSTLQDSTVKKFSLKSNLNLHSFSLQPFPHVLALHDPVKVFPIFPVGSLQALEGCNLVRPQPPLFQADAQTVLFVDYKEHTGWPE